MPAYSSPALEKGLDIIELLAGASTPMAQSQIASMLDRSIGEIFRVLLTLERRGYIQRDVDSGLYVLSTAVLNLAGRQPALRALILRATAPMSEFSARTAQSCNLAVIDGTDLRVIAQQESPADFGFHLRVGAAFPMASTATGLVLLAFCADDQRRALLAALRSRGADAAALNLEIEAARTRGFVQQDDRRLPGIIELAYPIMDYAGSNGGDEVAVAALTVPYFATRYRAHSLEVVAAAASAAAQAISRRVPSPRTSS